jgi:methylated-DNA-protein-cysteine methyltransferase-like protein
VTFSRKVYQLVRQIPLGKVATYGQIAHHLGQPKAARAVGSALHKNPQPEKIPCHRVVNHQGKVAVNFGTGGWQEQKRRLLQEGIGFKNQLRVDLERHQWPRSL